VLNASASSNLGIAASILMSWSPEQIAGWLKRTYPGELQNQASHETIYRSLFIQARGVLKKRTASAP
jgi:IS30 family transposase